MAKTFNYNVARIKKSDGTWEDIPALSPSLEELEKKQDKLEAGENITIGIDPDTNKLTISSDGGGEVGIIDDSAYEGDIPLSTEEVYNYAKNLNDEVVKTVNNIAPDENGNVNVQGGSESEFELIVDTVTTEQVNNFQINNSDLGDWKELIIDAFLVATTDTTSTTIIYPFVNFPHQGFYPDTGQSTNVVCHIMKISDDAILVEMAVGSSTKGASASAKNCIIDFTNPSTSAINLLKISRSYIEAGSTFKVWRKL